MSFLAPFYALAGLAIALPILFHLIRKQPRGNQVFSSLMFLDPSPPRLTRRSNIDQWLLLILRSLAILFLAAAFTRPFWNQPIATDSNEPSNRRILLIDTSASMRREGAWEAAMEAARKQIQQSNATDTLGVYSFDSNVRTLLSLEDSAATAPNGRKEQAEGALKSLQPTWNVTDLGLALVTASDIFQGDENSETDSVASAGEIIVVTDYQSGSLLDRLENYQWPIDCRVRIVRVSPRKTGNATANLQSNADDDSKTILDPISANIESLVDFDKTRVRISNEPQSKQEKFTLQWLDKEQRSIPGTETAVQVVAGSSMVSRIVPAPKDATQLRLIGDDATFDNDVFIVNRPIREYSLVCIDEKTRPTPENLGYFVEQLPLSNRQRKVNFEWRSPDSVEAFPIASKTPLMIASGLISSRDATQLRSFMQEGGHVLLALDQSAADSKAADRMAAVIASLSNEPPPTIVEAKSDGSKSSYSMLERIDFQHPLFQSLSDPRFNDFSKVRFWRHRSIRLTDPSRWQQLARFDREGDPAFLRMQIEKGSLWILASGWQPEESQLALSSKFVPILSGLFSQAAPIDTRQEQWFVGDRINLVENERLIDNNGIEVVSKEESSEEKASIALASPGIYQLLQGSETRSIAVNLPPSESNTSIADIEQLGRLGVNLAETQSVADRVANQRQLRNVELEAKQGWWRWLILGVIIAIGLESLLCLFRNSNVVNPSTT